MDKEERLPEGTIVTTVAEIGITIGEICGIAYESPLVGTIYIVKLINRGGVAMESYPYSCAAIPRSLFHTA